MVLRLQLAVVVGPEFKLFAAKLFAALIGFLFFSPAARNKNHFFIKCKLFLLSSREPVPLLTSDMGEEDSISPSKQIFAATKG